MPEVDRPTSWGDFMEFVREHHLEREEYFSLSNGTKNDEPLWGKHTRWIAVYWVEGGSEGYYVHVDRLDWNESTQVTEATTMALGKFWSKASAAIAVTYLTPFVYGLKPV